MSNIGEGSARPAPPAQAPAYPTAPPWTVTLGQHGEYQFRDYPGYPPPPPLPVALDTRTVTGLPWYLHVAFAFWAMLTCGYGIKHWVRAWAKAKKVARTRSV